MSDPLLATVTHTGISEASRFAKNNTNWFVGWCQANAASLSRFDVDSEAALLLLARPAGYHSGHVSACSSNEKCLTVNEINTDIRLAQQELEGKERARGKRSRLAGETEEAREKERHA